MIKIHLDSPQPLHDQLVAELRRLIATGELAVGDELPPSRQLAADLGINLNTVARAYRALADDGLLISARGRGTVVTASTERTEEVPAAGRRRVERGLLAALADAKLAGFSPADVRAMIETQTATLWRRAKESS